MVGNKLVASRWNGYVEVEACEHLQSDQLSYALIVEDDDETFKPVCRKCYDELNVLEDDNDNATEHPEDDE